MADHPTPPEPRPSPPDPLEGLIGRVLREQPLRRAPASLQRRVLEEIGKREAQPWWRSSFMHWPVGVRCAFLIASIGIVKFVLAVVPWATTDSPAVPVINALSQPLTWAQEVSAFLTRIHEFTATLYHAIPPLWLYCGLIVVGTLYVSLFALGATAYRMLYLRK